MAAPTHYDLEVILRSNQHPYSILNSLQQINALADLRLDKTSSSTMSTITITAQLYHEGQEISCTKTESSIKKAKETAAQEVLDQVKHSLLRNPPSSLGPRPIAPRPLSPAEERLKAEDRVHTNRVADIFQCAVASMIFPDMKESAIISVDLEMWENDHDINLEIGLSFVAAENLFDPNRFTTEHYINSTYAHLKNTRKNLDQRTQFRFGKSIWVSDRDVVDVVESRIEQLTREFRTVYIVGHTINSDITWLTRMGFSFTQDMVVVDIGKVYRWTIAPMPYNMFSMEKMLRGLGLKGMNVHNAGNDARYGLDVLSRLTLGLVSGTAVEQFIDISAH